ncbi:MAG: HEAT repeat domain-containing protein [Candidatus Eisenbacteria bacterium]
MEADTRRKIEMHLASRDPDEILRGLALARKEIANFPMEDAERILERVGALFYIDPLDRPDLMPVVDEAVNFVSAFGPRVIPYLVGELQAADVKAQLAVSHALGRMGEDAIDPLVSEYLLSSDPERRSFILYAMGKIKSPQIAKAAALAIESASSDDADLRDTAVRAIGKLAESIPPGALREEVRSGLVRQLRVNLADQNAGIRAKAVRSLGKLARYGHLHGKETAEAKKTFELLLGKDENFSWDRAYLVRREAEEALEAF